MDILELLHYTFFQHALLGSLFASIACGIIGTYIVTRRLVFISGGITHASFGGIGLGLYAGISPLLSAAIFSVLSSFGVEWLSKRKDMREDSAIAVFWTFGMAVGIIFSFLAPGFTPDLSAFLFGNILTITPTDILLLAILSVLLTLFFTLFLNPIICIAFDREFARSQRIPVALFEYILMMFIALTIVSCLRMVGIVLAISLLTLPQMTANLFTHSFKKIIWWSVKQSGTFGRTVSENHERTSVSAPCRETLRRNDLGGYVRKRSSRSIEYPGINVHAAGVHHRAEARLLPAIDRENPRFVILFRNFGQGIQGTDRHQRDPQPVAQSLSERNADTQPRIGAGPLADSDGIQLFGSDPGLRQQFIDENSDLAGVVAPLIALPERDQLPVPGQTDRTDVRAGFDT